MVSKGLLCPCSVCSRLEKPEFLERVSVEIGLCFECFDKVKSGPPEGLEELRPKEANA